MDISTGSWFKYLRESMLEEGIRDIGLPEYVIDYIEEGMPNAPEKAKTFVGHAWKKQTLPPGVGVKFELVNKLIDDYGKYVQADKLGREGQPTDVAARTVEPFDINKGTNAPRVAYDDETKKTAEQVKFVIQNLKNTLEKPAGTWMRSFRKALKNLSKLDIPSEQVENTKEYLDSLIADSVRSFWFKYDILFAFLNEDATHFEMIKSAEGDINEAYNIAQEYLNNKEDPSQIIHQFDDGYYWYNLETSNCSVEGERMGHCGGDTRGTLVSLRKKHGRRKESSSYITMTWDADTLYQIKGRSNEAPVEDSWPYIDWFVKNMGIRYIHETGEHASSTWEFQEMNDYLRNENPGVSIAGNAESMLEDAVEAIDQLNREFDDLENCSVWFDEPEDYGMGEDALYSRASAECTLQIDLGWKGFVKEGQEYRPTMGMEGQAMYEPDKRIAHNIPVDSYTGDSRDFRSELDVESLLDLPGDDVEIDYEVKMLTGAQPEGTELDPDYPQTAHLEITARPYETFRIWSTGMDNIDVDELEYFGSQIRNGFEEDYAEHQEIVRARLAAEGYALKSDWDRQKDDFGQMEKEGLENFYVDTQDTTAQFWFRDGPGGNIDNDWDGKISIDVPLYLGDFVSSRNVPRWVTDAFGTPKTYSGWGRDPFFENQTLNKQMARQLAIVSAQAQSRDRNQLDLPLGKEYEWKPAQMALANDTRFLVFVNTKYDMSNLEKLPVTTLKWRLLIKADSKDNAEEFEVVKEIVKLLNKNPDLVKKAANDVLDMRMEPVEEHAERMKTAILGGNTAMTIIRSLDSAYGASAANGDTQAERIIMIAIWIQDNWEKMDEVQKYVAQRRFLTPMNNRQFRIYNEEGQIEMDDPNNLGKPVMFDEYVAAELKRRGAAPMQVRGYSGGVQIQEPTRGAIGEPQRVGESIEQQISRIDNMLQEAVPDIRLYRTEISAVVSDERMEKTKQLEDQLRGLPDVTTVNLVGKTSLIGSTKVRFVVKFVRKGVEPSPEYIENVLLPLINSDKVPGVRVDPAVGVGWLAPEDVTPGRKKLNERSFAPFGGVASGLGAMRGTGSRPIPTPRSTLDQIAADWREGGVMSYDVAMDANNMSYTVMMPVEDLLPLISREFRAPMDAFDGMYQNFIQNGPSGPVYIAIGKNRVKITGNEDLVWYAKRSGLEELPVFLSYQSQV